MENQEIKYLPIFPQSILSFQTKFQILNPRQKKLVEKIPRWLVLSSQTP